jgi:tetraacyldisaccharide 4'-kinase
MPLSRSHLGAHATRAARNRLGRAAEGGAVDSAPLDASRTRTSSPVADSLRATAGAQGSTDSSPRPEERLAARGGAIELLRVPAALFGAIVRLRRAAYDRGLAPRTRVDVPVVSVGNLSTGGTGKTPFCAFAVHELERRGFRPGLLSRGYRSRGAELNDEGRLLARLCPGVPLVQDKDRRRGARELVAQGVDAIVLDDGFQHRQLARDLDLVLVDATRPWGLAARDGGEPVRALLPRGLLREPPSSLRRADAIVITRCEQAGPGALDALEAELESFAPGKPIARSTHRPRAWRDERGRESPLDALRGRDVRLVSALGHPAAFEASVRATGASVREHRVFPDHHEHVARDLDGLAADGCVLVTSAKDAVKLAPLGVAFQALEIELALLSGAHVLGALFDALPHAARSGGPSIAHAGFRG